MLFGILAGIAWALETVVLGIALQAAPFISSEEAIFLAPFIATFLHDGCSAIYMLIYNTVRGKARELFGVLKSKKVYFLILASAIGGPVGMTGYVMAVSYMGASIGAVASAIYPAVGTALAFLFLKERVRHYQWIFLTLTLLGVYGLSYSPVLTVENFWLGLIGILMCALGWGVEAVILARCFRDGSVKSEYALTIRQSVSALIYGAILLPVFKGWSLTAELFTTNTGLLLPTIALAALCATVSYTFYYKAIGKIGAAKAMALNITYTAWAIIFTVAIFGDFSLLNPLTLGCAAVIVIFGILAATDFKELFSKAKQPKL